MERHLAAIEAFCNSISIPSHSMKFASTSSLNTLGLKCAVSNTSKLKDSFEYQYQFTYTKELAITESLKVSVLEGKEILYNLYATRNIARAIPSLPSEESSVVISEYYQAIMKILKPEMEKLEKFYDYTKKIIHILNDNIQRITVRENSTQVVPICLIEVLVEVFDIILRLNELHEERSSSRSNFACYKRAFLSIKNEMYSEDRERIDGQIDKLQEFLGQNSAVKRTSIWKNLCAELTSIKRHEIVVYMIVKHITIELSNSAAMLLPKTRFSLLRVLPGLTAFLLRENFAKKLVARASAIFKQFPVVPLIEEIVVRPATYFFTFEQSGGGMEDVIKKHGDANKNVQLKAKGWSTLYDINSVVKDVQVKCEKVCSRLILILQMLPRESFARASCKKLALARDSISSSLFAAVEECLQILIETKTSLLLFFSSKYANPHSNTSDSPGTPTPGDNREISCSQYDSVLKLNLSQSDISSIVIAIHYIKSLASIFQYFSHQWLIPVQEHAHLHIQEFVQHSIVPILHHCDKGKAYTSTTLLQELRMAIGNWQTYSDADLNRDFKKTKRERISPSIAAGKIAVPSLKQFQIMRVLLDSIYSNRFVAHVEEKQAISSDITKKSMTKATSQTSLRSHIQSIARRHSINNRVTDAQSLKTFCMELQKLELVVSFRSIFEELVNLSSLWFRESYLESMKCCQVSIHSSMPWIAYTKYIVKSPNSTQLMHMIDPYRSFLSLSIVEIYNDAARAALQLYQKRWLYDEIAAESKLYTDLVIADFAEQIYLEAKDVLANSYHGAGWINHINLDQKDRFPPTNAFSRRSSMHAVLSMRQLHVVDQSVDVYERISTDILHRIQCELEYVLNQMEMSDSTVWLKTKYELDVLEQTYHFLAAQHFPTWDTSTGFRIMFRAINEGWNGVGAQNKPTRSRILDHVTATVSNSLCQNTKLQWYTKSFFLPSPSGRYGMQCCDSSLCLEKQATASHLSCGQTNQTDQCGIGFGINGTKSTGISDNNYYPCLSIHHVRALCGLLSLQEIVEVAKSTLFLIESELKDVIALCVPAIGFAIPPFTLPRSLYGANGCFGYFEGKLRHILENEEFEMQLFHSFRFIGNGLVFLLLLSDELDIQNVFLFTEEECPSLFTYVLDQLYKFLNKDSQTLANQWRVEEPQTSNPSKIMNTSSFYHIWGALEFLSCSSRSKVQPANTNYLPLYEKYGHGFHFAGMTLLHLVQQVTPYRVWNINNHILHVGVLQNEVSLDPGDSLFFTGDIPNAIQHKHASAKSSLEKRLKQTLRNAQSKPSRITESKQAQYAKTATLLDDSLVKQTHSFIKAAKEIKEICEQFLSLLMVAYPFAKVQCAPKETTRKMT